MTVTLHDYYAAVEINKNAFNTVEDQKPGLFEARAFMTVHSSGVESGKCYTTFLTEIVYIVNLTRLDLPVNTS